MLSIELIQQIDDISLELRRILELPVVLEDFHSFHQVTFEELSQKIMNNFSHINIIADIQSDDSYMIKFDNAIEQNGREIQFEIHIGTEMPTEVRVDSLMHEMAHYVLHKKNLEPLKPIGKYKGSPIQENEANCLARAFLIPSTFFFKALTMFSRNDGSVALNKMAEYFQVQESLVIERGRDLMIWN